MKLETVVVDKPEDLNFILGQAHFIKTVDDLDEAIGRTAPSARFGLAFCESSGPRLLRRAGNDPDLVRRAVDRAGAIGAGHSFVILLRNAFPVAVLNAIKMVPEVCRVYCATANPVQVIVASTELGRGIVGVIDGGSPLGVESNADIDARKALLRDLGYRD
jgi:hypothetical protein